MTGAEQRPDEFDLISRYFTPLADSPAARGLTDDAALLTPPAGCDLVLTKDALAAGVHFFADDDPAAIARKALRVNLSDLAAKGADPVGYLMALALPADWSETWIAEFCRGLREDQGQFGLSLLGGDTLRAAGGLTVSITAIGSVPHGKMVPRDGAKAGDRLFVTGTIGDAALGLALKCDAGLGARFALNAEEDAHLVGRYHIPQPRNAMARVLREHANAAMDVSDGLVGDLARMCRASGVSARIRKEDIPLSGPAAKAVAADSDFFGNLIGGGDDYELIAAVPGARVDDFVKAAAATGIPVTDIGAVEAGEGDVALIDSDGATVDQKFASYTHF